MKIAVIGAAGQLGRAICPMLKGVVIAVTRAEFDLTRAADVEATLRAMQPQVVINCAAYNLVDKAESEPEAAFAVNASAVRNLALACRALDATFVHVSTDYVFGLDASRRIPWKETDAPGPISAYGLSKLTGEYWARQISEKHVVVRTCGLYGLHGTGGKGGNFVETMLRVAAEGKPLTVVADQRCTPSYVGHVARAMAQLIDSGQFGLFHLTNAGDCSWHEFAAEIFRQAGLTPELKPIRSSEYPRPARRPIYSVLGRDNADGIGLPPLPVWQDALAEDLRVRPRS
jgi:dTDP-4-dehydrorhamnose reductase